MSRRLVFAAHRDGGQRQFVEQPLPPGRDTSLGPLLDWARSRLDQPTGVAELAVHLAVSLSTVHRRFVAELGCTPLAWLTRQRVELACRLLEGGGLGGEQVAAASGLGTAADLRLQLRRRDGLSPSQYRNRFATR